VPGPGCGQPVAGPLSDQVVLELGDRGQHMEQHPPGRRGSVDCLIQHDQVHAVLMQVSGNADQVADRPIRSSFVTTKTSPSRKNARHASHYGGLASLPVTPWSVNTRVQLCSRSRAA